MGCTVSPRRSFTAKSPNGPPDVPKKTVKQKLDEFQAKLMDKGTFWCNYMMKCQQVKVVCLAEDTNDVGRCEWYVVHRPDGNGHDGIPIGATEKTQKNVADYVKKHGLDRYGHLYIVHKSNLHRSKPN